jgi:hypothetical protein
MALFDPLSEGPRYERILRQTSPDLFWIQSLILFICDGALIFYSLQRSWIEIWWILFRSFLFSRYFLAAPHWKQRRSWYDPVLWASDRCKNCKWPTFAHKFGRLSILETDDVLPLSEIAAMFALEFFLPHYYHYERLKSPFSDPLYHYIQKRLILNFDLRGSSWSVHHQ